ncbi:MAG TPA: hypothetical protein VMH80_26055 [Bryobacteraceae bacterium]|nr:hypothetical protein [Bryobacteraceae bacterium]
MLSTLQQLQETNPTQYQQVTAEIASQLQPAAQTATSGGNTQAAAKLMQLSTDFQNASQNGQLPNVQDLANAIGGGHHHFGHHHHVAASSSNDPDNDGDTTSTNGTPSIAAPASSASSGISQLLDSILATSSTNDSLNPRQIILNALSNAGISLNH